MTTLISSHVKDKYCVFTEYKVFVTGRILLFHWYLYNKINDYFTLLNFDRHQIFVSLPQRCSTSVSLGTKPFMLKYNMWGALCKKWLNNACMWSAVWLDLSRKVLSEWDNKFNNSVCLTLGLCILAASNCHCCRCSFKVSELLLDMRMAPLNSGI